MQTLEPGDKLGDYEVITELGEGATATIYQVRRARDGAVFAAKVMHPSTARSQFLRERFEAEARILQRLHHPHIVGLIEVIECPQPVVIMEYVAGSSLEAYLPLHPGGMSEVLTAQIATQMADALAYAHERGVIHRDFKPSNVLLRHTAQGALHAYVADFGLAKILDGERRTASGLRLGTVAYMAPEQIQDSSEVDARADLYAVGISIYECLTGSLPFPQRSIDEVIRAQLTRPVPSVRHQRVDVSGRWDEIIARACAKSPEARYASAQALLEALVTLKEALGLADRTTMAIAPLSAESSRVSGVVDEHADRAPRDTLIERAVVADPAQDAVADPPRTPDVVTSRTPDEDADLGQASTFDLDPTQGERLRQQARERREASGRATQPPQDAPGEALGFDDTIPEQAPASPERGAGARQGRARPAAGRAAPRPAPLIAQRPSAQRETQILPPVQEDDRPLLTVVWALLGVALIGLIVALVWALT